MPQDELALVLVSDFGVWRAVGKVVALKVVADKMSGKLVNAASAVDEANWRRLVVVVDVGCVRLRAGIVILHRSRME
jgi:hypothetical protein